MSTTPTMTSKSCPERFRRLLVALLLAAAVAAMMLAVVIAVGARPAQAAFLGSNGKIAFASDRITGMGVDNPTGDGEIFTMNPDGTGLKQLTFNTALDYNPSISADGSVVVFTSNRDGNNEIYEMLADRPHDQFRVTNNTTYEDNPTISPDGFTIAYESLRSGNYEIIVREGGVERNLTNSAAFDHYPAFSPDGTKIAFTRLQGGSNSEVYVMDSDGTDQTNLSNNPTKDEEASWSPDGQKIAFQSTRNGNYDIYVMNALDGSSQKRLTKNAAFDIQPAWSPDGTKIAFSSYRGDDDYEVYAMKARPEGSKNRPKNLAKNDVVADLAPDWQPLVN